MTDVDTTTYRLFADLKGTAAGWSLDASAGVMYARMIDNIYGFIEPAAAQAALNNLTYVPGPATMALNCSPERQPSHKRA